MELTEKEKIEKLFKKGVLINEDLLKKELDDNLLTKIDNEEDLIILNEDYADIIQQSSNLIDWYDLDIYRVSSEKNKDDELYQIQLQSFKKSSLILKQKDKEIKQELSSLETELTVTNEKNDLLCIDKPLKDKSLDQIISSKQVEFLENKFELLFEIIEASNYLKLNNI